MINEQRITRELRQNMGIEAGDVIAVHSSLKSLGRVEGGPAALIRALVKAVDAPARGTLLMPCFNNPDDTVDLRRTPCRLGLVPETFRTMPGVIRSVNATHSVAVFGRQAMELADCHRGTTPLGTGSPFHRLAEIGGKVLHIGCDMTSCSLIHVAECLAASPYLHIPYPSYNKKIHVIIDKDDSLVSEPVEGPGDSAAFGVVQKQLEKDHLIINGRIGKAECLAAKGADILAAAVEILKKDPAALLCKNPACPVCPARRAAIGEGGF